MNREGYWWRLLKLVALEQSSNQEMKDGWRRKNANLFLLTVHHRRTLPESSLFPLFPPVQIGSRMNLSTIDDNSLDPPQPDAVERHQLPAHDFRRLYLQRSGSTGEPDLAEFAADEDVARQR